MFDYLIVGLGFSGAVLAERIAKVLNKKVLIVDKRPHIGGNAYDYYDEYGILIHKYGPHWFHTNDKNVFNYLSLFTEWRHHSHIVRTSVDGLLLPIPINMDTLNVLYSLNLQTPEDVQNYYDRVKLPIKNPANSEEVITSQVGIELYEKFFKGYTLKQWELDPKDLDASVTARIPIRTNRDDRYFTDTYQALPKNGYTEMFNNLLKHENITVLVNTDYRNLIESTIFNKLIYTGPIDSFFNYIHGDLPYRSLRFENETFERPYYQNWQQVNYPNDNKFTRIIEWKHATGQTSSFTTITKEFSYLADRFSEQFYPIPKRENHELFKKYKSEADKLSSVIFCGRLADYKYYNMDQVVARALNIFKTKIMV